MWRKGNPPYTLGGNANWRSHYGEPYGGSLKTKTRATMWSSTPTPGHASRQNHNLKAYMHYCAHSSSIYNCCCCCCWDASVVPDPQRPHGLQPTRLLRPWDFPGKSRSGVPLPPPVAKAWKPPGCLLLEEWIRKRWDKHTLEYHSAMKNETMPFAATWTDSDIIIWNEVSQKEQDKYTAQINTFMKQKQTHGQTIDLWLLWGRQLGEAWSESLGSVDVSYCT